MRVAALLFVYHLQFNKAQDSCYPDFTQSPQFVNIFKGEIKLKFMFSIIRESLYYSEKHSNWIVKFIQVSRSINQKEHQRVKKAK